MNDNTITDISARSRVVEAQRIVKRAEDALRYTLSVGEVRDLLKDNTQWPAGECNLVASVVIAIRELGGDES